MNPGFVDSEGRVARVIRALNDHAIVTLYGAALAGKSALAHAAIAAYDGTVRTIAVDEIGPAVGGGALMFVDGADLLDDEAFDHIVYLAETGAARWLLTRRRRSGRGSEHGVAVETLPEDDAMRVLAAFLERRGVAVTQADLRRLVGVATPLPGVLHEVARLVEVFGVQAVLDRWSTLDPLAPLLSDELDGIEPAEAALLRAACCFVDAFDAAAFESASGLDGRALSGLLDLGYLERTATDPPMFTLLRGLRTLVPAPDPAARARHAQWVAAHGGRADRLALAQRGVDETLHAGEVDAFVAAVARLCEGPLPPTPVVDAALAIARGDARALLFCTRSRIALRNGDPTEAAAFADQAAVGAASEGARVAVHSLRAQIARVVAAPADALAEYEHVLTSPDVPEDVLLEYAATLWESGDHDVARQATERALERARSRGDQRREGIVRSNLGVMAHHAGEFDQARSLHESALALHVDSGNRRFEGIAWFDLGALDHELGVVRRALGRYERAADLLDEAGDRRLADLARAAAEAARAQLGASPVWPIDVIEQRFAAVGDAILTEAVGLYAQVVAVLRGAEIADFDVAAFTRRPDELQLPARLLHQLSTAQRDGHLLTVLEREKSFELGPEVVDLSGREALWNTFALLVAARLETAEDVPLEAIIEHGWPGEIVTEDAAKNRAHVALSTLRRLGLRDVLVTGEGGYRLDVPIAVQTSTGPTAASS